MKVALDATPLTEPTGGIRRYTMELAKALAQEYPQDEYTLVSDQSYQHPEIDGVRAVEGRVARWWSWGLPQWLRREGMDVFHGTDFAAPYLPVRPSVMTIHDLSPWRTGGSARVKRRTPWLVRFGVATMIVTPSEAVRREVIGELGAMPEEVVAIPLAASEMFRPVEERPVERSYLFYAGMVEPRKNLETVVRAWREVRRRGWDLDFLIAGRTRGVQVGEEPGLRLLGAVADEALPGLYANAAAVVYPSLYEGFGLPVLEAMQSGAVVIASSDAALVELSGGACMHVPPRDVRAWVAAMEAMRAGSGEWREKGKKRAELFSWRKTAVLHREVYRRAMRRFYG